MGQIRGAAIYEHAVIDGLWVQKRHNLWLKVAPGQIIDSVSNESFSDRSARTHMPQV